MSANQAILSILFASFMWGSWGQFVKLIRGWSINAFMTALYSFSLVFTWVCLGMAHGFSGYGELFAHLRLYPQYLLYPLAGGILYTAGMWFNLNAIELAGLLLSYIIFSSIGLIFGTASSILAGGMPEGVPYPVIVAGCVLMLGAVLVSAYAGNLRSAEVDAPKADAADGGDKERRKKTLKIVVYGGLSGLLIVSYPLFMTLSMKTANNPNGLDAYQYMALLSVGSMITVLFLCIPPLFRTGGLKTFFKVPLPYFGMAALSGVAHYGGNILNAVAAPSVGLAISWPLGQTSALWAYFWGLVYGEFRGASKKVYALIIAGLALFILGTLVFAFSIYS